ncbi:hypothetical protein pipiens_018492 [Culex pipiens pipiens]|uniref:Uncharacterized protein n=1 Tax=Culex pipiens pipiens TaxID=38569 RepID=A0ABD1CBG9_CULPP
MAKTIISAASVKKPQLNPTSSVPSKSSRLNFNPFSATFPTGAAKKDIQGQSGESNITCRAVPKPQSLTGERVNLLEIAGHLTNPARTGLKIHSLLYGHLEPRTNPSEMVNHQANAKCEMDRFRDPGPGQTKHPVQQETIRNGKACKN